MDRLKSRHELSKKLISDASLVRANREGSEPSPPLSVSYLCAFLEVGRHGSISAASRSLRRAQSAVTRAIQQLERNLQVTLFERSVHGMLPTEFGKSLLIRTERAFTFLDSGYRKMAALAGSREKTSNPLYHFTARRLMVMLELMSKRHMGEAARALDISQPAVSQLLHEAEQSMGVSLFHRSARGRYPTPGGEVLVHHLRLAMEEIRIARDEIAALSGLQQGEIRVGVLSLGRTYLLPVAATRLLRKHPTLRISTVEGPYDTLAAALRAGELDFVIGALRPEAHTQGFIREVLLDDTLSVIVSARNPLGREPGMDLARLLDCRWVLPPSMTPTRALFEKVLAARGLKPPVVALQTTDLSIMREMLIEGDMVTAISPHQFSREIIAGMLVRLPLALPETQRQIGMLRRADGIPSPGAALLNAELRDIPAIPLPAATLQQ